MDIGLLLIRVIVGLLMAGHGAQKLWGWFGGHGPKGTAGFLESLGYRPGKPYAVVAGLSELAAGVLLVVGLAVPLAAAILIGVMLNAALSVHLPNGLWVSDGGMEYPLVLSTVAAALALTGPGQVSLDAALGWSRPSAWVALAAVVVGILAGLAAIGMRTVAPAVEEALADDGEGRQAA